MNKTDKATKTIEGVEVFESYRPPLCDFCSNRYDFKVEAYVRCDEGTAFFEDLFVCKQHVPKVGDRY